MEHFVCQVPIARPCTSDSFFDEDFVDSVYNKTIPDSSKRKRETRAVRKGDSLPYVDPCSRKHFRVVSAEAKEIDRKERAILIKRLVELGVDEGEITSDIPIWDLAESYQKILMTKAKKTSELKKKKTILAPSGVKNDKKSKKDKTIPGIG